MSKYILTYQKKDNAIYISHLDFLRTIQRAIKRAELPIKYSQGFNPHQLISFALPLSVGISAEAEIFELELEDIEKGDVLEKLNDVLPAGICITKVEKVEKSRFNLVEKAEYEIITENPLSDKQLSDFLQKKEVLVDKKSKKGIKEQNIRDDIFELKLSGDKITAVLSAGSTRNLSPVLLVSAIEKYTEGYSAGYCRFCRIKLIPDVSF